MANLTSRDETLIDIDAVATEFQNIPDANPFANSDPHPHANSDPISRPSATSDLVSYNAKNSLKMNLTVGVQKVSYSVQEKKASKPILHEVSCSVKNREMLCILGPSGSGKSSLIDVIAGRISNDSGNGKVVSGAVLFNGLQFTSAEFQRIAGLVTQEDIFNACLTVRETLSFAAGLRLPAADRKARVQTMIKVLQLESCERTRVGDDSRPDLRGISGGEKRRLAIAMELLRPGTSLLLLDEPTSGLDAASAQVVVNLLHDLVEGGLVVVATLHQPRASILKQFNKLMMLVAGQSIYYGSVAEYIPYVVNNLQLKLSQELTLNANSSDLLLGGLADTLLDAVNPASFELGAAQSFGILDDVNDRALQVLRAAYLKSDLYSRMDEETKNEAESGKRGQVEKLYRVGWFAQFGTLFVRTALIKLRDPMVVATQIGYAIFMGGIFGAVYWQCYDRAENIRHSDAAMGVAWVLTLTAFMPMDVVLTFPVERRIFLRERMSGLYSTSAFYPARILADVPSHFVASSLMALITYAMIGLRMNFLTWVGLNVASILVGSALMTACGAMCRTFDESNMLVMIIMMLGLLVNPVFLRQVPGWLAWLSEISFVRVVVEVGLYYEFKDSDVSEQLFQEYSVHISSSDDAAKEICILVAICIITRLLTYFAVKFMHTGQSMKESLWM